MPQDPQQRDAAKLVTAAIARLDARGLIDHTDDVATLSVDGITTLHDAVTLFALNTSGDNLDDADVRLAHDAAVILQQTLNIMIFADADTDARTAAKRQAITALKRAARTHTY